MASLPILPHPGPQDPSAPSPAASSAAEELLQELCCQTWRVELDYGLQGAEAQPVDRLLLACSGWVGAGGGREGCCNKLDGGRWEGEGLQRVDGLLLACSGWGLGERDGMRYPNLEGGLWLGVAVWAPGRAGRWVGGGWRASAVRYPRQDNEGGEDGEAQPVATGQTAGWVGRGPGKGRTGRGQGERERGAGTGRRGPGQDGPQRVGRCGSVELEWRIGACDGRWTAAPGLQRVGGSPGARRMVGSVQCCDAGCMRWRWVAVAGCKVAPQGKHSRTYWLQSLRALSG